jgi:exopolysaccharide biosynthesis protein
MKVLCLIVWLLVNTCPPVIYSRTGSIHQIVVDLSKVNVTVCVAADGGESFSAMCEREQPLAAITGNFYDPETLQLVGELVIDGKVVNVSCDHVGPALVIFKDGQARIVSHDEYGKLNRHTMHLGMQAGPRLVCHGKVAVDLTGFHIAPSATRTAIGLTADHKLIMIAVNSSISFTRLASAMLASGCVDALTLDGGSSTGLYVNDKVLVHPARIMVSILAAFPKT